ncbi:MAG: amidohydrolase family protein, partial [Candidatus Eremiobacteraeota bacterium]|nr:amidohydrolase family protein [Candidatus Eremiobacteraeota bacterium]
MLALTGATIFPTPADEPIRNGTILIDGSTIAAVGSDLSIPKHAEVMDCAGCTVMAGFWNCHVHFFERKWADARAIPASELAAQIADLSFRYGFTTLFDIGSMWDNTQALRERIESGEVLGPRIYTTGEAVLPLNGRPDEAVLRVMGVTNFPAPEVSSAAEAVAAVRALLNKGVDAIKLFASSRGTTLDQDVIEAAVVQAHRAGKPVFIHPNDGADVARALRAGVDVIAHTTPSSGSWE